MTDQIDTAAIRARVEAATPGPYTVGEELVDPNDPAWNVFEPNGSAVAAFCTLRHATLFACAPTDLAALCDEVERLRSELDDARNIALGLTEDCAGLRAIIAGRTTPPTDAEIEVHHAAGGSWMYRGIGRYPIVRALCRQDAVLIAEMIRTDIGGVADGSCWWALSAQYAPCAWPVVTP